MYFTWNPKREQVIVTESFVRGQSLVWSLPAGGIPIARHGLDHHNAQREVSLHRCLIVMDRLAQLGGTFGGEPFLLVYLKAAKLILGNSPSILSWVTDWVLVAEVDSVEACFNAPYLLNMSVRGKTDPGY